ncbi:MAG: hypothetical protein CFH33_01724, partial [Alphaproteobacteria bacterium MarineAlpha9_Bin3]
MIKNKNIIKNHFDKLASSRDIWIKKSKGFYSEDILCMKELIPSESKVLEIGCGNGNLLSSLKPSYGLGIDISKEMIIKAKEKNNNLTFIEADIEDENSIKEINEVFDFIILS